MQGSARGRPDRGLFGPDQWIDKLLGVNIREI